MKSYISSPIDHKVLPDKILDYIRDKIITGKLKAGEKVSEAKLSDELRISRTPIREAIRLLECEGFIEIIPRKGAVVKKFSKDDILNTFEIKAAIEALAVKDAAPRMDAKNIAKAEQIIENEKNYYEKNEIVKAFKEFDNFTSLLIKKCSNQMLLDMNTKMTNHIIRYRFFCFKFPEIIASVPEAHIRLVRLIKNKKFSELRFEYENYYMEIGKKMADKIIVL
jgi:DNA-binding GntR family transcriptional regulator